MVMYEPLWETMKRKEVSQYGLSHKYGISAGQIRKCGVEEVARIL